ncbi:MAG TPA: hypothetical protein DDZ89_04410, partial [Clostridiales bacterium]|nr:hypothetical protein [Clostridiales bacterium]
MENKQFKKKTFISFLSFIVIAISFFILDKYLLVDELSSGITPFRMIMNIALIMAATFLFTLLTVQLMQARNKP